MYKKLMLNLCVILLLLFFGEITAQASTAYGFETVTASDEEQSEILENINVKSTPDPSFLEKSISPIVSFDVSESGNVLLGLKDNRIAILDKEGKILQLFEFETLGSFYVQWNGDNILLLLVRSSIVVEMTSTGQLVNMVQVDDNSIQNNSIWNRLAKKDQIDIDGNSYSVQNKMGFLNFFMSSYSQLLKTDQNGNTTVIYDVNTRQLTKTIAIFTACLAFIVLAVFIVTKQFKTAKNQ